MTMLGIKEPKLESRGSVLHYLSANEIDTNNVVYLNQTKINVLYKNDTFKPGFPKGLRMIQFILFDKKGNLISQYSTCERSIRGGKVLESFPPKNIYPLNSGKSFEYYSTYLVDRWGYPIRLSDMQGSDYFLFVYYATFTGRPGLRLLNQISEYCDRYKEKKIKLLKVNLDFTSKEAFESPL